MLLLSDLPERVNENPPSTVSGGAKLRLGSSSSYRPLGQFDPSDDEPHNIDVEQGLLGALLINASAYDLVAGTVQVDHFYDPLHGEIYRVICALLQSGQAATPTTVRTYFSNAEPITPKLTVPQYLGRLAANAATLASVPDYARIVYELFVQRKILHIGQGISELARYPAIDTPVGDQIARAHTEMAQLQDAYSAYNGHCSLEFAADTRIAEGAPDLIEGLLSASAVAALYGPSRAGKTFLALDMATSIALGQECLGRRTQKGAVLYVLLEGRGGFAKRLHAATQKRGDPGKAFARLKTIGTLGTAPESAAFASTISGALKQLSREAGESARLVIIDTLACALAGDNENDAATMSAVLAHANRITSETGATVLLVAHPGKDKERGMRGSSALFAGCDDVIEIDREEGASTRSVTIRKHRDGEEGSAGSFTLEKVDLGRNEAGEIMTSCVVVPDTTPSAATKLRRPPEGTGNAKALAELEHLLIAGRFQVSRSHPRIPDGIQLVDVNEWRAACATRRLSEGNDDSERKAFNRAKQALSGAHWIWEYNSSVWLLSGHSSPRSEEAKNA